jgi:hypothetical protein
VWEYLYRYLLLCLTCNVIERIFGILKRCFRLMVAAPEYVLETQAKFPPALAAIHNFICVHDLNDVSKEAEKEADMQPWHRRQLGDLGRGSISWRESQQASKRCDDIANVMWRQYIAYTDVRDGQ